jgi:hypothetical protein
LIYEIRTDPAVKKDLGGGLSAPQIPSVPARQKAVSDLLAIMGRPPRLASLTVVLASSKAIDGAATCLHAGLIMKLHGAL